MKITVTPVTEARNDGCLLCCGAPNAGLTLQQVEERGVSLDAAYHATSVDIIEDHNAVQAHGPLSPPASPHAVVRELTPPLPIASRLAKETEQEYRHADPTSPDISPCDRHSPGSASTGTRSARSRDVTKAISQQSRIGPANEHGHQRLAVPKDEIHHYIHLDSLPPKQKELLQQLFHTDDDIDLQELLMAASNFKWQTRFGILGSLFVVFAIISVGILSTLAGQVSKDTAVDENGVLWGGYLWQDRQVVRTAALDAPVALAELSQLPASTLLDLKSISLTQMVNDAPIYHHYKVEGFTMQESPRELILQTSVSGTSVRFRDGIVELIEDDAGPIRMAVVAADVPAWSLKEFCRGASETCNGVGHGAAAVVKV